jgi:hypothetical protein
VRTRDCGIANRFKASQSLDSWKPREFRMRSCWITAIFVLASAPASSWVAFPQTAEQSDAAKDQKAVSKRDLTGIWAVRVPPGVPWYNYALTADEPPMTAWAEIKFKSNKPSFGPSPQEFPNDLAYGCFPPGVPRVYAAVQAAMQIVQVPGRVIMFFGRNVRQVYTDGRQHPQNLKPLWMGHSIGKWEGETFVIDTIGVSDRTWLDRMGHPHSDALHLVERFRRDSQDRLDLDMTIDDPKAFTKAWTAQRTFRLRPLTSELGEAVCEDMFINEAFGLKPMLPSAK